MKKQLDTTGIANELRSASVFFAQEPPPKPVPDSPSQTDVPQTAISPEDLSEKEKPAPAQPLPRRTGVTDKQTVEPANEAPLQRTTSPTLEATKQRANERTVDPPSARAKVRHTFDVFADQVTSLKRIGVEREETFHQRYRLGDLVQEALDAFITKQRNND